MTNHDTVTTYFDGVDNIIEDLITAVTYEVESAKDRFLTDCREYFEDYAADDELTPDVCDVKPSDYLTYSHMDLTIGFNYDDETETVTSYSYQTGDNSFTGLAYNHPHWIVISITPNTVPSDYYRDILEQFDSLTSY